MTEPVVKKEYYSIGDVCDLTDLKAHVLRYWETQFPSLSPNKNKAGNRIYRKKDVKLVLLVKHLLYEEKYTIEGAEQKLRKLRRGGETEERADGIVEPEFLQGMRDELTVLRSVLDPESDWSPDDESSGSDEPEDEEASDPDSGAG